MQTDTEDIAEDNYNSLSWGSFFQCLSNSIQRKTNIGYGPFVPESPTSPSVVLNSLEYFISASNLLNQQFTIVTADQAIYEIILALKSKYPLKLERVIARMGGFHIIMNFLGAIGHLMSGSGIEELLVSGRILVEGTAKKVISGGKDYYQMVRCHSLVYAAIFELYWEAFQAYVTSEDVSLETSETEKLQTLMEEISRLQKSVNSRDNSDDKFISFSNAALLMTEIQHLRDKFEITLQDNPTAKLWLMYMDMVSIMHWYIYSERSGIWEEHLFSVEKMLPSSG